MRVRIRRWRIIALIALVGEGMLARWQQEFRPSMRVAWPPSAVNRV